VAAALFASAEYRRDLIQNDCARFLDQPASAWIERAYLRAMALGLRDEGLLAAILGSAEYWKLL
jgi:hypothetical protein